MKTLDIIDKMEAIWINNDYEYEMGGADMLDCINDIRAELSKREDTEILDCISILADKCSACPYTITDTLTGYLWDEEEAGQIKEAITKAMKE